MLTCSGSSQQVQQAGAGSEPPTGSPLLVDLSCPEGFDAVRCRETAPNVYPQLPVTEVQFRCSGSGNWSAVVGAAASGDQLLPSGPPTTVTAASCPAGWVISSGSIGGNATMLGRIMIDCSAKGGVSAADPLATCPYVPGYSFVPGYLPAGATNMTQMAAGTSPEAAGQLCTTTSACNALLAAPALRSSSNYTWTPLALGSADPAALQAAMASAGHAFGGCSGTYVRPIPGPRQYFCGTFLAVPGQVLSSSQASSPDAAACAAACNSNPSCTAFMLDPSTNCVLLAKPFNTTSPSIGVSALGAWGINASAAALGCIAASEPYYCLPPGWDVDGYAPGAAVGTTRPNPEACRAECDAQASCSHFVYEPSTFSCSLRSDAFRGGSGAAGPSATAGRTCLKTPQHHSLSQPAYGGGGVSLPHGHACYMGVSLGGSIITTFGGLVTTTACAKECFNWDGCGHWHLQTNGNCQLFKTGTALREGYSTAYGPMPDVAVACLAAVTGTYHCLPPRQAVAYTQLSASSSVATRAACAQLCSANAACSSFQFTAASGACILHTTTFYGPSGGNTYSSSTAAPDAFEVCLRTLSARALFSDAPRPPRTDFGGLPLSSPSSAIDNGYSGPLNCKSPAFISGVGVGVPRDSNSSSICISSFHPCWWNVALRELCLVACRACAAMDA